MMANQTDDKPSLPKEYVQLEYLKATGTQFLNLGKLGYDNRLTVDVHIESKPDTNALFGCGINNSVQGFSIIISNHPTSTHRFDGQKLTMNVYVNKRTIYTLDKNGIEFDEKLYAWDSAPSYFETNGDVYLLAFNVSNKAQYMPKGLLYRCEIFKNDILVHNLIPALRIADLKPGMYDLVTGQFFVNQGTGEFVFEMPNALKPYLYFEALEDGLQVSITKSETQYSLDKVNWIDLPATESTQPINQGQKVYFKGNGALNNSGIGTFTLTKLCRVGGNPNSLHYGDSFDKYNDINSLQGLFKDNQNLLEIVNPKTFIPNKTGGRYGQYRQMFYGCSNLVNAPIIYIKKAGDYALRDMFRGVSNINYVVMLAEELSESYPFQTWLYQAASSGTIVLNKNITWNPNEVNGLIPNSKWEVKYCDPDNIEDVRDYRESDKAWDE
jgi:hypothetical protein